jgi:uncharacterized protein
MTDTNDSASEFADRPWMDGAEAPDVAISPARGWLLATHATPALVGLLFPYGTSIIPPLLIWQLKAKQGEDQQMAEHSVEALNFQINLALVCLALSITLIGLVLVPVVLIAGLVFSTIATIKASQGQRYHYPWIHRFVSTD